jgi:hypothetical protein
MLATGSRALDSLLGGGLELGLLHLLYGSACLRGDLLRFAVRAAMAKASEGLESSVVIVDSLNMVDTARLADIASSAGMEPETVFQRIHLSRSFNSSQTYDLVMNHLAGFLDSRRAQLVLLPGLVDIFVREGIDARRLQQVSHMAAVLMHLVLNLRLACVVSSEATTCSGLPRVGNSMLSYSQVHVLVKETPMRILYALTKHPHLSPSCAERTKERTSYYVTVPLDEFIGE